MHPIAQTILLLVYPIAIFAKMLDICIFDQQAQQCPQPAFYGSYRDQNKIQVNTNLISVIDANTGQKANKLRLPGTFKLTFGEIIVSTDLDFMFSDVRIELEVPGFGKLNALPTCDNQSHSITVGGPANEFCRYCDICELTTDIESKLQQEKIMEIGNERFSENCHKLRKNVRYSWSTGITLPGAEEFQRKYGGKIDSNVENALTTGKGKITVKVRLLNQPKGSGNNYQTGICILNCGRQSGNSKCQESPWSEDCLSQPCLNRCREQAKNQKSDCQRSVGHLDGFDLVGCYDIDFQYEVKEPSSPTQDSCSNSNGNPCRNDRRFCCGCTRCGRYAGTCSQQCMAQPRESCVSLFA